MFADRGAPVAAEPPPTERADAPAPLHTTTSAPTDYSWERVAGFRLGRRSVSPQHAPQRRSTTELVCEPVSWEDAAGRPSSWAHNATLIDPCFHHPRSSFSRSINASIAEDDIHLRCAPPVEVVTDDRRRPPCGADRNLPLQPDELDVGQDEMFRMDDDELQLPPETYTPSSALHCLDSAPDQRDHDEEAAGEAKPLPIPLGRRGKPETADSHSPVFRVL